MRYCLALLLLLPSCSRASATDNYHLKCSKDLATGEMYLTYVYRCENQEVVCYVNHQDKATALQCHWKGQRP